MEEVEKLVAELHDKTEYVIYIRNFKQAWNHGLVLKKVHRVIKFIQKKNPKKKKRKNWFGKKKFKLMNNANFGKTMENVKKHGDIKLVTTERRNYLVSEPNYRTTKFFTEHL